MAAAWRGRRATPFLLTQAGPVQKITDAAALAGAPLGPGNRLSPDEASNMMGGEGWALVRVATVQDGWTDGIDAEPPRQIGRTSVVYLKMRR